MKGMGAAGVSVDDELARTTRLIAEAKKQGITIIGSHIEDMAEKAVESYWLPGDQLWSKYTNYF